MTALPAPGTRIAGRYRLKDRLEQHAFGGLFTAAYEPFESKVFMELIRPECVRAVGGGEPGGLGDPKLAWDLRECLQRAAQVRGPNLCGLIEWFEEGGFVCIAFEHTAGVTLRELLDEVGNLPLEQGLEVLHACVEAAGAAYGCGICYLALDPRNLLITPSGPVKLMRAGYFQVLEAGDPILRHESMLYRAPEAVRGMPSRPSDVYALAVMLREMLGPSRPPRLETILSQATAADPASRPAARPLLEALVEEAGYAEKRIRQDSASDPALPRVAAGFPKPATGSPMPSDRSHAIRRYLIALAIILAAAYLMTRFIGGCRPPQQPGYPGRVTGVRGCAVTCLEPPGPAQPALSPYKNQAATARSTA